MLFSLPLADIEFRHIEAFCRVFPEGVRVEYKSDLTQMAKVVSSFANTVGGLWILGVKTDNKNMPILPLAGMPLMPGLEERIVQSALMGVYPPIAPQVKVVPLPSNSSQCLIFVRIFESIEAPHAIENSTKMYIRVASVNQPFQLADIDRIEYLLQRRRSPAQRREELIRLADIRSPLRGAVPSLRVLLSPVYPHKPLLDLEAIYQDAERRATRPSREDVYLVKLRRSHNALLSSRSGGVDHHHFELDRNGLFFLDQPLTVHRLKSNDFEYDYYRFSELLWPPGAIIRLAHRFLTGVYTNMIIRVELRGNPGVRLLLKEDVGDKGWVLGQTSCVDNLIAGENHFVLETLSTAYADVVTDLLRQIAWPFNCTEVTRELVEQLLTANRLLPL